MNPINSVDPLLDWIEPVPLPDAGKVLSNVNTGSALVFVPIFIFLAGIALMGYGFSISGPESFWLPLVLVGTGLIIAILGLADGIMRVGIWGDYYLRWQAARYFRMRSNCCVLPDDPDAIFIEIVYREDWNSKTLENASDLGFLKIDTQSKTILIEGDKNRYRIPVEELDGCILDGHAQSAGSASILYFFIVLQRWDADWELPFRIRQGSGSGSGKQRLKKLIVYYEQILDLNPDLETQNIEEKELEQ